MNIFEITSSMFFSQTRLLSKTILTFATGISIGFFSVQATTLVEYDFENTTVTGESPERVWTIYDKAGPPFTNTTASETTRQTIDSFNGGSALRFITGTGGSGISLGMGAEGELNSNFSSGLVLQATFQITDSLAGSSQVLFSKFGTNNTNRTFSLMVFGGPQDDPSGNDRRVQFILFPETGSNEVLMSNLRIEQGQTYHITAVFDPFEGLMSMDISGYASDFVNQSTDITGLYVSDASFYVGGRYDGGNVNRFVGYIDDLVIAAVPEPSAGGILFLSGTSLWFLRRKQSRYH